MNLNNIIWSKGPIRNFYSFQQTELVSSEDFIIKLIKSSKHILWIRNTSKNYDTNTDLDFVSKNLEYIAFPLILITTDGDRSVPSSYNKDNVQRILECPKIIKWYTQNYDKTIIHQKLNFFPIGLDLHTSKWLINNSVMDKLKFMIEMRKNTNKMYKKIICDAHLSISHTERIDMYKTLKENNYITFLKNKISFEDITYTYNTYQFALSPRGNGYDCHRTWELFLSGCIVITKTSPLDEMFINNNLPVVIIKDWNELNENIENKLNEWYLKYNSLTSFENIYPKYSFDYWVHA
jgi:hypothetical protein